MPGESRTRYCSRCLTTFPTDVERCPNLSCRSVRPRTGWGELLEPGEMIDRTYRVQSRLAIGGAGVTYLGREVDAANAETGPYLAIKVLYQQRDQGAYLRRLATEAQILQGISHANIVECRGFVHRTGHSPYLVTRFEEGGSLLDHIRRVGTLPIQVTANIGRQIGWALDVAHRQGVVHRDLKPENVLLVKPVSREQVPEVRVADFGIAKVYGGIGERLTRMGAFVGTPQYAAPEQFEGLAPEPATDIYALGALLYFLMTARPVADFMAELDPDSQRTHLLRHLPAKLQVPGAPQHVQRWMEQTLAIAMAVDPGDRCDITTLDRRLADIAADRDPGFVRLPPAPDPSGVTPNHTLAAEAYVESGNSTDEVQGPPLEPPTGPSPVEAWKPGDRSVPDPSATPIDAEERRLATPARVPSGPPPDPATTGLPPISVVPGGALIAAGVVAGAGVAAIAAAKAASPPSGPPPVPPATGPVTGPPPVPPAPPVPPVPAPKPAHRPGLPTADELRKAEIDAEQARRAQRAQEQAAAEASRPKQAPRRSGGSGGLAVGLLGAMGLGLVAILTVSVGWWWWYHREPTVTVPTVTLPKATVLTGSETEPRARIEWQKIASLLGQKGAQAEHICLAPPYVAVQIIVDPAGKVLRADLLNYPDEQKRLCMEKQLQTTTFPRTTPGNVQVAVTLPE